MEREREKTCRQTLKDIKNGYSRGQEPDKKKDDWMRLRELSDRQRSGACTVLYVIKNNNVWTEQKGQIWHFSGVRGKVTSTGCTPWSPNPPASPASQSHLPSLRAGLYISPLPPHFTFFSLLRSAAESIELQKHWIHPSRKCAPNTGLLWPAVTPGRCSVRGYQPEQRRPRLRPVGHPGEQLGGPGSQDVADGYL